MLDNLIKLIRDNAGSGMLNDSVIPADKNDAAVETAGSSIMSTLQGALSGGRLSEVFDFFKGGGSGSHGIVQEATNNYARDLQANIGLSENDALDTANKVVPNTMSQLASKTADPADNGFDIQDIFNKLSGGKTNGMDLQGMLSKFTGGKLDKDGDGDVDFQDLKSAFSGGGGLMDKVKGLFN